MDDTSLESDVRIGSPTGYFAAVESISVRWYVRKDYDGTNHEMVAVG
jgi:hypothetical protein